MRKALNSNPVAQLAMLGVLVLVVGLLLMPRLSSRSASEEPSAEATAAPSAVASPAPLPVPATPPAVDSKALIPGPGLPAPLSEAFARGDAVVLLAVRAGGIDDALVRRSVHRLRGQEGVAVFVTRAEGIVRYARVTQGLGVDRLPALIVVRPRRLSGSSPRAAVSYGFRSAASVVQAVRDALYVGPDQLPYYPR